MAEIPKIVVKGLQTPSDLLNHPDANLMTGFVENSLTASDRNQMLAHLARCNECRDVVALSLPERVEVGVPAYVSGWLSWPVLRWAGAAACIVVVGTVVTLHYESRPKNAAVMVAPSTQGANVEQKATQPAPIANSPQVDTAARDEVARTSASLRKKASPNTLARSLPSTEASNADAQLRPQLQSSEAVEARTPEAALAAPVSPDEIVPGRAKEAEAASDIKGAPAKQLTAGNAAVAASRARALPRWTLASDGTLQRSLDGGITWENVPVAPQKRFRALAANGFDIWVGGASGALYHSFDAGQHWMQVRPVANGEFLEADIIGVEFPDAVHGKISTSTLEDWTTDDAGQHWQKK